MRTHQEQLVYLLQQQLLGNMKKLILILTLWASTAWGLTVPCIEPGCGIVRNDLTFVGSGTGLTYGNMSATNNATTMTVDADLTETKITIFDTNGASNNVTVSNATDTITINKTGVYFLQCNASVRGTAGAAQELHFRGVKNSGTSGVGKSLTNPNCDASCATNNLITATHNFSNGDVVYPTAGDYGLTALTEYYVCNVTGTASFSLSDHADGGVADCNAGNGDIINITADTTGILYQVGTNLTNMHVHVIMPATVDSKPFPIGGIESLTAGDVLEFNMHTDSSTTRTITVEDIFCSIFQIGG